MNVKAHIAERQTAEPAPIMVLRRWFVPSERIEEFTQRWQMEIMPEIRRQPGCLRVEAYKSSVRDHWVTASSWDGEESRLRALEQVAHIYKEVVAYERFEAEILTLSSHLT